MKPFMPGDKKNFAEMQDTPTRELVRHQQALSIVNCLGTVAVGAGVYLGAETSPSGYLLAAGGAYLSYRASLVGNFVNQVYLERYPDETAPIVEDVTPLSEPSSAAISKADS